MELEYSIETESRMVPVEQPPKTHYFVRGEWDDSEQKMYGLYALTSSEDGQSITDREPLWIEHQKVVTRWRRVSTWQDGPPT